MDFSQYILNMFSFFTITIKMMYLMSDGKNTGIFAI